LDLTTSYPQGVVISGLDLPFESASAYGVAYARLSEKLSDAGKREKLLSELSELLGDTWKFVVFSFADRRPTRSLGHSMGKFLNPCTLSEQEIAGIADAQNTRSSIY